MINFLTYLLHISDINSCQNPCRHLKKCLFDRKENCHFECQINTAYFTKTVGSFKREKNILLIKKFVKRINFIKDKKILCEPKKKLCTI